MTPVVAAPAPEIKNNWGGYRIEAPKALSVERRRRERESSAERGGAA